MSQSLTDTVENLLWHGSIERMPAIPRLGITMVRFVYAVIRDVMTGNLTLRAMGLVYVTILSIVPVIAISFSVLKAFGFHRRLEPLLYQFLLPLGEKGEQLTSQVMGFVDNVKGDVLAGVGLLMLFFTAVSMAQRIEASFNFVWRVDRPRSLARRMSEYLSVILVGPVIMVTALALITRIKSTALIRGMTEFEPMNSTFTFGAQLAPYLLVSLAFTFVYWFVPNTRVKLSAAAAGGLAGGIMWSATGALFATFVVGATRTADIYATFAIVIIALIWIYLCWAILLIGAQLSFYVQNPQYLRLGYRQLSIGSRQREQLALSLMLLVANAFRDSGKHPTVATIASGLGMPNLVIVPVLDRLEAANLIARTNKDQLLPSREPGNLLLRDIVSAVREPQATDLYSNVIWPEPIDAIGRQVQSAMDDTLGDQCLDDLMQEPAESQ